MLPAEIEGRTRSSSAAAPPTCPPGWPGAAHARSASTTREAQLATARELQQEFGLEFPLIHGNAEHVPLPDAVFDLAISEYGASIWCDPYRWIPEAARLLRPGGELVFLGNRILAMLCVPTTSDEPAGDRLLRPHFGMHRFEWPDDDSVEFHLPHGAMIALLRDSGFEVEELIEVRPPADATNRLRPGSPSSGQGTGHARRSGGRASAAEHRRHPAAFDYLRRGMVAIRTLAFADRSRRRRLKTTVRLPVRRRRVSNFPGCPRSLPAGSSCGPW